jgi:hypothetical protein
MHTYPNPPRQRKSSSFNTIKSLLAVAPAQAPGGAAVSAKCNGCGRRDFQPAPMMRDEVWLKLADAHELLCIDCMWRRQHERHVSITINSLKPCLINLARFWFDLFARHENAPPENIAERRAIARDIGVICKRDCQPHPWLIERANAEAIRDAYSQRLDDQWRAPERARGVQLRLPLDDEAVP